MSREIIYAEDTGSTTEKAFTLTVNLEGGKPYYLVPKGFKFSILSIDIQSKDESTVILKVQKVTEGTTPSYTDATTIIKWYLTSPGHLHQGYSKDVFVIEALDADVCIFLGYVQPTGNEISVTILGELEEVVKTG